jgi:hypothetical protein
MMPRRGAAGWRRMRYFFAYELPKIDAWLAVVARREAVCREMQDPTGSEPCAPRPPRPWPGC